MSTHRKAYLEISNRCNLSCAFCPGTVRAPRSLSEEEFIFLSGRVRDWAEYLYFHLMGEPTAHPLITRFTAIAHDMGLKPIITTNGTLLPFKGDEIIASHPYKINVSLHAFEANPPRMSFEEYVNGCLDFAFRAADAGIISVLRLWNLDGRADGALHEKNSLILSAMHDHFKGEWKKTRSGEKLSERVFLEWGEKFDWPDLNGKYLSDEGFCYGLRDQVGILCDGTVVPCCLDRNGDISLGNLFSDTLENILASERARKLYDSFTSHKCSEELCKRCMRASYYRTDKAK